MRFWLEMKKQQGQSVRSFLEFSRLWHTQQDLEEELEMITDHTTIQEETQLRLDKEIEVEPSDARGWYKRGSALSQVKEDKEAWASLNKAIELDRNYESAWCKRGAVALKLKLYEEALGSYEKAIKINASKGSYWSIRGALLLMFKRYEEGLTSLEKAIELEPNYTWAQAKLGVALGKLGRHEQAIAACNQAIEGGEKHPEVFFKRAECLLALSKWDEGNRALDQALKQFSAHINTGNTKGTIQNLFKNTNNPTVWQSQVTTLIAIHGNHQAMHRLGQGLARCCTELMSEMVSNKTAQAWLEVWQEAGGNHSELEIPIRLVSATIRQRQRKDDKRVLLELPIEERNLLKPLLGDE